MMKTSHLALGVLSAYAVTQGAGFAPLMWTCAGAVVGSVLPDFDLRLGIPHRGVTHFLVWPVLLWWFSPLPIITGLAIGWAVHILADCLTVEGLRPLWPLPFRFRGFVRTGKISEYLVLIPLLVLMVLYVI